MYFSATTTTTTIAALVAATPFVAAHGNREGHPSIFGLPRDLKTRAPVVPRVLRYAQTPRRGLLETRQGGQDGRCGPNFGNASCDAGFCCSGAGFCGTSKDHCAAPDCQLNYGPACDGNKTPSGASTRNDPRPQKGSLPYGGAGIYGCRTPGTVAITYDDGPYVYTNQVLDQFKAYGFHATFFVTGNNNGKGPIDTTASWSSTIRRMDAEGHQVASHTWSHQDLSAISDAQRYDQMVKNEMAVRNILGKYPTYMRPPYSSCNAACQSMLTSLGYVIAYFDLDTDDYNQLANIQVAQDNFKRILDATEGGPQNGERLAIAHDIHEQTATTLTAYMLKYLKEKGYRGVTMGECLGDAKENWYRSSGGGGNTQTTNNSPPSPTSPVTQTPNNPTASPSPKDISNDGTCGVQSGKTCLASPFGNCCSQFGWCGSTNDHCGSGCDASAGSCVSSSSSSSSSNSDGSSRDAGSAGGGAGSAGGGGGATNPPSSSKPISADGQCGTATGATCLGSAFGSCCSAFGWCGAAEGHCGVGCRGEFGTCS